VNSLINDTHAVHFEALFRRDADPRRTRTRWYERRKRALALASLPRERYERAYEPACGAGELTAALAQRCGQVVASDASGAAVQTARKRLAVARNVQVHHARVPDSWPDGSFDLIVIGELGYYLSEDDLARTAEACRASLRSDGNLLACHWRRPESDMHRAGAQVHDLLQQRTALNRVSHYEDDDFLLDIWSPDPSSIAQREGIA